MAKRSGKINTKGVWLHNNWSLCKSMNKEWTKRKNCGYKNQSVSPRKRLREADSYIVGMCDGAKRVELAQQHIVFLYVAEMTTKKKIRDDILHAEGRRDVRGGHNMIAEVAVFFD